MRQENHLRHPLANNIGIISFYITTNKLIFTSLYLGTCKIPSLLRVNDIVKFQHKGTTVQSINQGLITTVLPTFTFRSFGAACSIVLSTEITYNIYTAVPWTCCQLKITTFSIIGNYNHDVNKP